MRLKDLAKNRDNLSYAGVFMTFLAFSFLSFTIVSPIVSSNADTNNASIEAGPYIASISADQTTDINITPTNTQTVYTGTNTITYTNTCPYGFNVTISSNADNTSLVRFGDDSAVKEISSTTTTSLSDNTWGVSTDGGTTYKPVPAISSPTNIINTFEATTNPVALDFIYGVKTNNELPSGSYTRDVIYTVSAKPQCLTYGVTWDFDDGTGASGATYPETMNFGQTINLSGLTPTKEGYEFTGWSNGTNTFTGTETDANINPSSTPSLIMTAQWKEDVQIAMQDFSCDSSIPGLADGTTLIDSRDGNTYSVRLLADGNCWMTENLRLANRAISSADSNLPPGETWTVPESDASAFVGWDRDRSAVYCDSTYGCFYSFAAATAGWGTNDVKSGSSSKDICPKGWRLPSAAGSNEFAVLYNKYHSAALMQGIPGFTISGYVVGDTINLGVGGHYWSSTVDSSITAHYLFLDNKPRVYPSATQEKYFGYSVRCVAESRTLNDLTRMQDMNSKIVENTPEDSTATLVDSRDYEKYTVRKLKDGKIWMTQNLKTIDMTISSGDSNLPTGDTWTIPASSTSGFSAYNTNNAYLDSTYGGYYTFYTATAGWGTDSVESGNAPKDICPRGWRLPTGGSSGEFRALYNNYNSAALMMGEPNFTLSGSANNGSMYNQGGYGSFWSSTIYDANNAQTLYLDSSTANPGNGDNKYNGFSVRCVAI